MAKQIQITKTETKTRAPRATGKGKQAPVSSGIAYGIQNGSRPAAGRMLFAFTHAWLSLSGMAAGGSYSRADAVKVAGATAISYHTGNGNLKDTGGMLTLTAKGQNFFSSRGVDAKMTEAYVQALKTGKPQDGIIPARADGFLKV